MGAIFMGGLVLLITVVGGLYFVLQERKESREMKEDADE
jgi:hypothetical protein